MIIRKFTATQFGTASRWDIYLNMERIESCLFDDVNKLIVLYAGSDRRYYEKD